MGPPPQGHFLPRGTSWSQGGSRVSSLMVVYLRLVAASWSETVSHHPERRAFTDAVVGKLNGCGHLPSQDEPVGTGVS